MQHVMILLGFALRDLSCPWASLSWSPTISLHVYNVSEARTCRVDALPSNTCRNPVNASTSHVFFFFLSKRVWIREDKPLSTYTVFTEMYKTCHIHEFCPSWVVRHVPFIPGLNPYLLASFLTFWTVILLSRLI